MAMALVAGAMLAAPQGSAASESGSTSETRTQDAHVRSVVPALKLLIDQATERSATFSQLVETIDASDSYVYVQDGDCGHGVRACFVDVWEGGPGRIMRVIINMHKKADWDLMASIGHELRHTIEVIANRSIQNNVAKYFFYEKIGTHGITGTHETRDAVEAGNAVRSEVRKFNRQAKSE